MTTAIALRNVTKSFTNLVAVDRLDLTVPSGSLYGFIGPNGSGKTTTLRMIMHILLPDEGEIEVLGQRGMPRRPRLRQLSSRRARALQARCRCAGSCAATAHSKGRGSPSSIARSRRWLERLSLSAWIDRKIESLSKGMAQKVQFIAAVLNQPQLLILDEPFSGLDPVNMPKCSKTRSWSLKKAGTTIVFSTHDMHVAERLCNRIFMIHKGRKVLDGTLDEIQSRFGCDTFVSRPTMGSPRSRALRILTRSPIWEISRRCGGPAIPRSCWKACSSVRGSRGSRSLGRRCTTSS